MDSRCNGYNFGETQIFWAINIDRQKSFLAFAATRGGVAGGSWGGVGIPIVGGMDLDLNRLFVEVTSRGGTKKMDSEIDSQNNEDIQVEEVESVDKEVGKGKRKRKERSVVWTYFEKDQNSIVLGSTKLKCTCKKCNTVFVYDSIQGTGNLLRHKDRCYGKNYRDVGQMLFNSDMALRSRKFNQKTLRELLVACTVRHKLPLSFVEYKGVRDVIEYLEPEADSMTRNTLEADLIEMYKLEKEKMKSMLMESPGMLCLTSNLWSSINTDGYLAITVHFINNEWVLQKRVLAFSHMPPPHSGVALNAKVFLILEEWGLGKKIFCITLDNASSNDRFVQLLRDQLDTKSPLVSKGRFFHMRCCAHIVNLIVQDGLKKIDQAVEKVRESIKYVKGSKSQVRKQKFLDCVKLLSLSSTRGLRQDCPTRWNSTFLMLDSAFYYRKAFTHLEISDSNYTSCPGAYEWDTIEKISVFLAVFYDVTNVFSGTKYPTANLYYPHIFMVYFTLHDSMSSKDEYMRRMGASMMEKFKKYWSDFSLTLAIAVVFDPRYKLHFIEWGYTKIYGELNCQYSEVDLLLSSTFAEYVLYFGNASSTTSYHASTSSSKADEATNRDTRRLYGVRAKLLNFDEFQS
uniref:zinc finger BED domain-containing protein RICESLEEPER 2-like n=1 Tax=Erigeron canadensis TaxID=72917 RepID=UPI001CB8BD02|nr:zinc finger BED domain-containing protein RICESLEEPER 2-like [Erigeron canadensis]